MPEYGILTWGDIDTETYLELLDLHNEDLSPTEYWLEVIATLKEIDVDELTADEYDEMYLEVKFIQGEPRREILENINGRKLKRFNELTFGELIDCTKFINGVPLENIHKVNAILYGGQKDFDTMCKVMLSQNIKPMYTNLMDFIEYHKNLIERYSELFDVPEDGDEPEEKTENQSVFTKWSWEKMIWDLCNGDITRARDVTSLPHIMVLNWVLMEKELKLRQPTQTALSPYHGVVPI